MLKITDSVFDEMSKYIDLNYYFSEEGEAMYEKDKAHPRSIMLRLLTKQGQLTSRMANPISFAKPMLTHGEHHIIYPNTINVIQGQTRVHKSRIAETILSVLLSKPGIENHLGFTKNQLDPLQSLYIDTRRNMDQFSYALQQILIKAGYPKEIPRDIFSFIPLMEVGLEYRFEVVRKIIECKDPDYHLFIILDISDDCVQDSNNPEHAKMLIDLMNDAVNDSNCTFLCVIDENSGSERTRGYLESKLMNIASTVIKLQYEELFNQLEVKFLTTSNLKRPITIDCMYSDTVRDLVLVQPLKDDAPF